MHKLNKTLLIFILATGVKNVCYTQNKETRLRNLNSTLLLAAKLSSNKYVTKL